MARFKTVKEAAQAWVREFNAIPQALIERAYNAHDGWMFDEVEHLTAEEDDLSYALPMWGTMWTFGEKLDEEWAERNIEAMKECGFEVYRSDELGIFFGINGAGYDFYDAHWIPLYKARGLQWHEQE